VANEPQDGIGAKECFNDRGNGPREPATAFPSITSRTRLQDENLVVPLHPRTIASKGTRTTGADPKEAMKLFSFARGGYAAEFSQDHWRSSERRQWWLSSSAIAVSLILTSGIVCVLLPSMIPELEPSSATFDTNIAVHALVAMILLFDVYVVFQQVQLSRFRKRLAEREELFRLISENAADMIAVVDTSGQRLYNSPSYQKLLGYSQQELGKTSAFDQIHEDDRRAVLDAASDARRTGMGRTVEYRIRHKDGRWLTLESTASVVRNRDGEVEKLVIVNRDITERKQLEEQLHRSQKLEAIGRLSGGVAHDFNNLLGLIIGYSEALQEHVPPDDPYREAVDEIQNAGKRAAALTQQLLAFSRKQVLEPRVLSLNTIIVDIEKMLRRLVGEDITIELLLAPDTGMVKADRSQIEQVILNLVVNGRDAMSDGGKLIIETGKWTLDRSTVLRHPYVIPGPYAMLKVTDTGCGMDTALQSHIFEPFFTTKEKGKGTGLGLATAYGVIKQSGGYIWVDSEVGKGTTFRIYLPEVNAVAEAIPEAQASPKAPRERRTILVVEDERSLRKLTRKTLSDAGHKVFEAGDASEALEILRKTEVVIDLLLTDVIMPGMSGKKLADVVVAERPGIGVLYMSGYADGEIATHGILEQGTAILRKPFTRDELMRQVDNALVAVVR
jgi:two-component system cell cycle sensor histidine kinase/response regulator CckA